MYWNLLKAMKESNITIQTMAKIINKSANTVHNKLKRKYDFTYDEMLKIKKALKTKLPLEKLFYWETKEDSAIPPRTTESSQTEI